LVFGCTHHARTGHFYREHNEKTEQREDKNKTESVTFFTVA